MAHHGRQCEKVAPQPLLREWPTYGDNRRERNEATCLPPKFGHARCLVWDWTIQIVVVGEKVGTFAFLHSGGQYASNGRRKADATLRRLSLPTWDICPFIYLSDVLLKSPKDTLRSLDIAGSCDATRPRA